VDLAARFRQACPGAILLNLYGSSEVAADATWHEVRELHDNNPVPIGRPIYNTRVYILDSHLEPVPIGVKGQIYVGGDCLAAGYWHSYDSTAERFVPGPFEPEAPVRDGRPGSVSPTAASVSCHLDHGEIRSYRIEPGEVVHLAAHRLAERRDRHLRLGGRPETRGIRRGASTPPPRNACVPLGHSHRAATSEMQCRAAERQG
jgi:non-ribosomal peptide synthetase component F